ncbi:MAG TPA: hypothetical protein VFR38_03805 [Gaiellaceae bacterium]|nr:hypothetical protein [Gaiellaceae bacterium]
MRRALPLFAALGLVAAVLLPYLALGGASFEPTPVADPCQVRDWRDPGDVDEVLEQIVLSALDGAACVLDVSREDLVLAVQDEESLDAFAEDNGFSRADAEQAVRDGLLRAVEDAEEAGAIGGIVATLARRMAESVPPWLVIETLESLSSFLP